MMNGRAAIVPYTSGAGGGGGDSGVTQVDLLITSPDGTVSQPSPSSSQMVGNKIIVSAALSARQGQINAFTSLKTKNKVITPDQVTGQGEITADDLDVYDKATVNNKISVVDVKATGAVSTANQANQNSQEAESTANKARDDVLTLAEAVDDIIYNLDNMECQVISDNINGTMTFDYENKIITLRENFNPNTLVGFVKSVAGALPDAEGDASPTPDQLDVYSKQSINDKFDTQQQQITTANTNITTITNKFNGQTAEVKSPDGTVVGTMGFDALTSKWTLSLRADQGGASTLITSETFKIENIQGGYKIDLMVNPDEFEYLRDQFDNPVLNSKAAPATQYEFTGGTESHVDPESGKTIVTAQPTLQVVSDLAQSTQAAVDNLQGEITSANAKITTAQHTADGAATTAGLALAGLDGVNTKINNTNAKLNSISAVTTVNGQNPQTTNIDPATMKLPINVDTSSTTVSTDGSLQNEIVGQPKATQYSNANPNWTVTLKEVVGKCVYPQLYVRRDSAKGNTSGGRYGIYQYYSSNQYNLLMSCNLAILTEQNTDEAIFNYIYSKLNNNSEILFNFVNNRQGDSCAIPKSAFSLCANMTDFAAVVQTKMRTVTNPRLSNATAVWDSVNFFLTLSSGDLDWQFDYCGDWLGDNANNLLGLTPQKGAFLLETGFSGLLDFIIFDAHDGFANASRLSKPFTQNGNTSQFIIEIYESGTYLPSTTDYALLTYNLVNTGKLAVNQNKSYEYQYIAQWNSILPTSAITYSAVATTMKLVVLEVRNKKPSPYKNLFFTAVANGQNNIGQNLIMLVPHKRYGLMDPVGQPLALNSGVGFTATFEDDYIFVRILCSGYPATNPITIYSGNSPDITITNNLALDANNIPVYETFVDTGLVDKTLGGIIKSTLSAQNYNNNFVIVPAKNMILRLDNSSLSSGGSFQLYFLFNKINYTQTFTSTVMIPFEYNATYTNCKIRIMLPTPALFNGKFVTANNYVDLTLPATINFGQTLFLNFEISFLDSQMNVNCALQLQPLLSMQQELGSYAGKTDGQSNFALGLDAIVTGYKIMPEIGKATGVTKSVQNIDGLDYYLFTLDAGNVYNIKLSGYMTISNYYDGTDNPTLVGLINIDNTLPVREYYAVPVRFNNYPHRQNINSSNTSLKIDLTNDTAPKVFRVLMSPASAVSGVIGIISDALVINFRDNADGV